MAFGGNKKMAYESELRRLREAASGGPEVLISHLKGEEPLTLRLLQIVRGVLPSGRTSSVQEDIDRATR